MKITLDIKSLLIGILSAGLVLTFLSSKNYDTPTEGRFRIEMKDKVIVILDTETGKFLIAPQVKESGEIQWEGGYFEHTLISILKPKKKTEK